MPNKKQPKTVAIANLGMLTSALETSLEYLGLKVIRPEPNNINMHRLSANHLAPEMCYPLKLLLGNYLSTISNKADAVIFYSGCDICNLNPVNTVYKDIFNELNWFPEIYNCNINSKKDFLMSYLKILSGLGSRHPWKILKAIQIGFTKYELLTFTDQVFYNIRPYFKNFQDSEYLYKGYISEIESTKYVQNLKRINQSLLNLYNEKFKSDNNLLTIGIIGDTYSVTEQFACQNLDLQLGKMGIILDRWSKHPLCSSQKSSKKYNNSNLKDIFQNSYGVFTKLELDKLTNYINRDYDGIIFVSPLSCNPNDAMRNLLTEVQNRTGMPILSLVFDEHTSNTGINARLEAFIDIIQKQKISNKNS